MAMFKETSESISKISYMLAVGQMSSETKAAMKAQAKVDLKAKELDNALKTIAYKKEKMAITALERDATSAALRQSTTPTSASLPTSVDIFDQESDSDDME
jgi:hypothetical protein